MSAEHADTLEDPRSRPPELAPALASVVLSLVCTCFGALAVVAVLDQHGGGSAWLAALLAVAMVAIQLGYFTRPDARLTPVPTAIALVAQAALVFLPVFLFGIYWLGFPGFLVGSLLVACPAILAIPASVLVVAAVVGLELLLVRPDGIVFSTGYMVLETLVTGLTIFGLTRLARLVVVLHDARDGLSRMAVAEERLRFARDTHDVLGMSLSAITLQAELASRLIDHDPERARAEIADVLGVSRRALTEVRMIASGRNTLSLSEELGSAQNVLGAADIEVTITDRSSPQWSDEVRTLFATAVRESITNVLRHTRAGAVSVHIEPRDDHGRLVVANDGADAAPTVGSPLEGHGLRNLAARTEELDGRLDVDHDPEAQRFVLTIEVPCPPGAPSETS